MALMTSLCDIHEGDPCEYGWAKLTEARDSIDETDTRSFPVTDIYKSNDFADMLWVADKDYSNTAGLLHGFAIWCAKRVEHLVTDPVILNALRVAERYNSPEGCDAGDLYDAWSHANDSVHAPHDISVPLAVVSAEWALAAAIDINDLYGAILGIIEWVSTALHDTAAAQLADVKMMELELCRRLDEYKEDE